MRSVGFVVANVRGFHSKEPQKPLHTTEKLDAVKQWIQPTVGDAVVQVKRRGVMFLVM